MRITGMELQFLENEKIPMLSNKVEITNIKKKVSRTMQVSEKVPIFAEDAMREFGDWRSQVEVVELVSFSNTEFTDGRDGVKGQNSM